MSPLPSLEVANASFVTDRLLVGGDLEAGDLRLARSQAAELAAAGVTHVLDARLEWRDDDRWREVRVDYRWDGIDDAGQAVPAEWFDAIVEWGLRALRRPDTKVLAHCHMGINRGPSAGFALMLATGWEPVAALAAIRRARPIAHVAYAEDALRWRHLRTRAGAEERRADFRGVSAWRRANRLDVAGTIRRIRTGG